MESRHDLLAPSKYIGEINRTESYRKQRSQKLGRGSIRLAVGAGATEMAQFHTSPESKYRTPEGDVHNVIAHISGFADGVRGIDRLTNTGSIREQRIPHLKKIIEFNHAVKDLIDSTPSLEFDGVVNFITDMYSASHDRDWKTDTERKETIDWFHNEVRYRLAGMRHEIAAEQIIGTLDNIEIIYNDDATIEELVQDDIDGVDVRVKAIDLKLGLDIKGSRTGVEKKRAGNSDTAHLAIWSQLHDNDFIQNGKNGFRISPAKAAEKAKGMRTAILQARDDERRMQQQRYRRRA